MNSMRNMTFVIFSVWMIAAANLVGQVQGPYEGWTCYFQSGQPDTCTFQNQNGCQWNLDRCSAFCDAGIHPNNGFTCSIDPGGNAVGHCICDDYPTGPQCQPGCEWVGQECICSPLMIDLQSNTVNFKLSSPEDGVVFDIAGSGVPLRVAWPSAESGVAFVTMDLNQNGTIDGGHELFGTASRNPDGSLAPNGFEALKLYDNGDDKIDARDSIYSQLRLWSDRNRDGRSDPEELVGLGQAGVTAIYLSYEVNKRTDRHGNRYRLEGTSILKTSNGKDVPRRIFDVFLATNP